MIKIWCIEKPGEQVLVRDDITDPAHAKLLVEHGNHGAAERGMSHRYVIEPDLEGVATTPNAAPLPKA